MQIQTFLIKNKLKTPKRWLGSPAYGVYATIKQKWYGTHLIWQNDLFHIAVKKNDLKLFDSAGKEVLKAFQMHSTAFWNPIATSYNCPLGLHTNMRKQ